MIANVHLQHIRSYGDTSFEFGSGVNIIVGPNASGKTNLLESLLVMARGSSYRARDIELVAFGADWGRIGAALTTPEQYRVVKLQRAADNEERVSKLFEIDNQPLSRLHHGRTLPLVLFEPNHLLLLSSVPELRRGFLDDLVEQIDPSFTTVRRHYRRVLSQRNSLLKQNPADLLQQLFVWNLRLSELGGKIAKQRRAIIEQCNSQLTEIYDGLAESKAQISLRYQTRFTGDYETQLLHTLEKDVEVDVARGFTSHGPHRDDMEVLLNGHVLQEAASRGEIRSVVLALKVVELRLLEGVRTTKPLLLLDDVFSELDSTRREALTHFVGDYQTFITTTDAADVSRSFPTRHVIQL